MPPGFVSEMFAPAYASGGSVLSRAPATSRSYSSTNSEDSSSEASRRTGTTSERGALAFAFPRDRGEHVGLGPGPAGPRAAHLRQVGAVRARDPRGDGGDVGVAVAGRCRRPRRFGRLRGGGCGALLLGGRRRRRGGPPCPPGEPRPHRPPGPPLARRGPDPAPPPPPRRRKRGTHPLSPNPPT